ncbi:THAP domain-containing protein 11-like [Dermacentor silvarum]|uniref:THAP domain-containing protein 11-like n=1 Tax=Dermacentor silvarum TaxID=543639 RepID=UPI0021019BD6|nr:THAP domain-containing protein 11-like [Dermacentor silvarum]
MVYCCVPFCKSSGRTSAGISFHEFPVTDVRVLWLKKISRQGEGPGKQPWAPSDRSKVCSLHFKPDDYREGLKSKRLKPDAVPSVFPHYPVYLQEQPKKGRRELKHRLALSPADGPDVDAKRKKMEASVAPCLQPEGQSVQAEIEDCADYNESFEPLSTEEQCCSQPVPLEKFSSPNFLDLQLQDSPKCAQTPTTLLVHSTEKKLMPMCLSQEIPSIFLLPAPEASRKTPSALRRLTRAQGMQTRLSSAKIVTLVKQVKTLKRKCQRLLKKQGRLQEEASSLKQQAKKMDAWMKKSNFTILQV